MSHKGQTAPHPGILESGLLSPSGALGYTSHVTAFCSAVTAAQEGAGCGWLSVVRSATGPCRSPGGVTELARGLWAPRQSSTGWREEPGPGSVISLRTRVTSCQLWSRPRASVSPSVDGRAGLDQISERGPGRKPRHLLGTCQKCTSSGLGPDLLRRDPGGPATASS